MARGSAILGLLLAPLAARAQGAFSLTPTISVSEIYDDNLFGSATGREADFISRFSVGLQAGYESTPFTLLGGYTVDAEVFAEHPELTETPARQQASLDLRYLPTRTLTLSLGGTYAETQAARELAVETGLELGRERAERLSGTASVAYRFDPLTRARAGYTVAREEAAGVETDSRAAELGLERRLTSLDTGSLAYAFREFDFDGGGTTSHVVTLGWTHEITPVTTLTLRAGARVSDGAVDPEASASIRHRFRRGALSLAYSRAETTVVGVAGAVESQSVTLVAAYEVLPRLEVRITPGFFRSTLADREAEVYAGSLDVAYRITSWLTLAAAYAFGFQRGSLTADRPRDEEIRRNVVMLTLTARYPYRLP